MRGRDQELKKLSGGEEEAALEELYRRTEKNLTEATSRTGGIDPCGGARLKRRNSGKFSLGAVRGPKTKQDGEADTGGQLKRYDTGGLPPAIMGY